MRGFHRASESAKQFNGNLRQTTKHATGTKRGMEHLRHGLVFATGGLIGTFGIVGAIEKSVDAARDLQDSTFRMNTAFRSSHVSLTTYAKGIREAEEAGVKLGFTTVDTRDTLGSLVVATHDGSKALNLLGVAQDIARFKNISLTQAGKLLVGAMTGSQRATKSLGLTVGKSTENADAAKDAYKRQLDALKAQFPPMAKMSQAQRDEYNRRKNLLAINYDSNKALAKQKDLQVTAAKVIQALSTKLHGQAKAYSDTSAGAQERFAASLHETEAQIGRGLLPALTKLSLSLSTFLNRLNASGKTQVYVRQAAAQLAAAFRAVRSVVVFIAPKLRALNNAFGGTRHSVRLLIAAFIAFKALKMASTVVVIARTFGLLGARSRGARGGVASLRGSLIGKAGLVVGVGAASFALTTLILKLTGADKWFRKLGGSAFDAAAKLGIVNDPTKSPNYTGGRSAVSQQGGAAARYVRSLARRDFARGLNVEQTVAQILKTHPGLAPHDVQVLVNAQKRDNRPIHVHTTVQLDGATVGKSVTKHQQKHNKRNTTQRGGRNAGYYAP